MRTVLLTAPWPAAEALQAALRDEGVRVERVDNAMKAVVYARGAPPSAIVLFPTPRALLQQRALHDLGTLEPAPALFFLGDEAPPAGVVALDPAAPAADLIARMRAPLGLEAPAASKLVPVAPLPAPDLSRRGLATDPAGTLLACLYDDAVLPDLDGPLRAAASVTHPALPPLAVAALDDARPFAGWQLERGATVEALSESGPLPLAEVLEVARATAAGLDALHRARLTHGAVRPPQLWVTTTGTVQLLFAGAAGPLRAAAATAKGRHTPRPVHDLAPEEVRGSAVGVPRDLYQLGVTLFELVSGAAPFADASRFASLERIRDETAPPLAGPPAVAQLAARLLDKDPGQRPGAAEVALHLDAALDDADGARAALAARARAHAA